MKSTLLIAAALAFTVGGCDVFQTRPPEQAVDVYAAAQARMGAGDYPGAAAMLTEFVSLKPRDRYVSDAWLLLGDCRTQMKDSPGAEAAYTQAAAKPRTTSIAARAQAGMGQALAAQGRDRDAIGAWEQSLRTSEASIDAPAALMGLGRLYLLREQWLMARDRLGKIVRKYPASPQAAIAQDMLSTPGDLYSVELGTFASRYEATGFVEGATKNGASDLRIVDRPGTDRPFAVRSGKFVGRAAAAREADRLKSITEDATVFP